jgi:HSP20 family protein
MQIKDLLPWNAARTALSKQQGGDDDNPVAALQRDINRMFDSFWRRFEAPAGWQPHAGLATPQVDVAETDSAIEVTAELPGLDEKDIELSVTDDALTLKGEKKHEREEKKKGYYLSERSYGSFYRTIPLPAGIDTDKVNAVFKKGVLTVTLPKSPEAQARVKRVEIKGG